MARGAGSTFDTVLPIGKRRNIGMINWGFVNGKTQTDMPWDSWQRPYTLRPPTVWLHDISASRWHAIPGAGGRDHQEFEHSAEKDRAGRVNYFQGVTGGTLSVGQGASTEPKSAGETISRYSMSGE